MEAKVQWLLVASALAVAPVLFGLRGSPPRAGGVMEATLTLVTADKHDLSCALEVSIGGHRCDYPRPPATPGRPVTGAGLQPFVALDGTMFLVANLFGEPAVARRYAQEPPQRKARAQLRRFTARCRLHLLQQVDTAFVRFGPSAAWGPVPKLWVAEPLECRVSG
jgi:hypothetical protein